MSNDTKIVELVKEWRRGWKVFNDKHSFDDGWFDPSIFPHTHVIFVCCSFVENRVGHEGNLCNLVGTWLKGIDKLKAIGIFGFITPLLLVGS